MPFRHRRRTRRSLSRHPFLLILGFALLFLAPVLNTIGGAQVLPIQAQPTATPTEAFDPPLQARSTLTPTPRVTEEPEAPDAPDDVQANPTEAPETVVDDIAPNPEPATLTLNKGVCDDTGFDPYTATGLDTFQDACFSPDGEFEFTVSDGEGFAESAMTSLGSVQFTVPAGNLAITETIPEGFGDPAVFCWSNLLLTPAAAPFIGNGPGWDIAEGEQVECWWFNVSEPAPNGTITIRTRSCPSVVPYDNGDGFYKDFCTDFHNDVEFALTAPHGVFTGTTAGDGTVQWTGIPMGEFSIQETVPDGYGEPIVLCDFDGPLSRIQSPAGLVSAAIETSGTADLCVWFNVPEDGAPDDLTTADTQEGGAGNTVTLVKHRCPMGVVEDAEFDDYEAICTQQHDDIAFTLDHSAGSFPGTTAGGQVQWTDVPAGDFAIQETVPTGFLDPLVWCGFTPSIQLPALMPSAGGLVTGSFEDDVSEYVCYWFNIPDPDANNTISIYTYACPAGVPYVNDNDFYKANCPESHPGVEFTLSAPHGVFPDTTDGDGLVAWTAVPLGESSIQETIPDGFGEPVVICNFATTVPHGLPFEDGPLSRIQSPGGLVSAPIDEPNVEYRCSWFNIPDGGPESRVLIDKRICADDVDLVLTDNNVINDIITACPETGDGIEFTLDHAEGSSTQAIVDGATWWDGVPNGPVTVTEEIPAGYGEPVWYCSTNPIDESGDVQPSGVWELGNAPGGVLDDSLDEPYGEVFHCWVFNVRAQGNDLLLYKAECPAGASYEEMDDWYFDNCGVPLDGISFTVTSDLGIASDETVGGVVAFGGLPAGEVGVAEEIPADYGSPVVICNDGAGATRYDAPTGSFSYDFPAGDGGFLTCWVFNITGEDKENSVTILKWRCPEGSGSDEDQGWYETNCVEEHDGVEFTVASGIGLAVLETAGGSVQFDGLPAGTAGLQETIPEGFGPPVVFCATDAGWAAYPAPTGHWEYEFAGDGLDQALACHVYNIPGEPGSLTLLKWTCPPGYDLNAAGANPKADCTEATDGIDFQFGLSGAGEAAVLQTTGDIVDGGVFFDDLEPETYKAVEVVPEGIEAVFVLECTGHIMGVLQPYPLQMGNVLEIEIDAGEHLTCHWYNVPDPGGGTLTVIKYTCTTETFVSEVDCEIEENGKTFDLLHWNVDDGVWEVIDTQVTDGVGLIAWIGLEVGDYGLDEQDGEWCHLTTNRVFGPGDFFSVFEGEETVVSVYNCDGEPGKPGDTPEKYPNTGVPPARDDDRLQP